ncbi:Cyclin-D3-1 [Rhynchospora pubera]|uniref:Cyclin-D3-1 n=1 Tax=Rhynchospora pubera TaxID=906938 RepID=A0AAV8FTP1_9POAL|nr:Cyclin-D3-1 [Rhynchospora pubera]
MGIRQDLASSILLCSEENNSILFFEDGGEGEIGLIEGQVNNFYSDFVGSFPMQSEECIELLVERESQHFPNQRYLERLKNGAFEASFRRDAIEWISKVHSHFNFGPQTLYLSINYFDRFLSAYELPKGEMWMQQLLSLACLSLAVKMEESILMFPHNLQICEAKYVFEAKNIQRMELLVLSTLNWRLQAVTPFSFIDYFLRKLNQINSPSSHLFSRCIGLILTTVKDAEFLQFRPSEIAAAVALAESSIKDAGDIDKLLGSSIHIEKVLGCYKMIQAAEMEDKDSLSRNDSPFYQLMPQSPVGVLDAITGSYITDGSLTSVNANPIATSFQDSPAPKRRKL